MLLFFEPVSIKWFHRFAPSFGEPPTLVAGSMFSVCHIVAGADGLASRPTPH